jgi:hypothetical protein
LVFLHAKKMFEDHRRSQERIRVSRIDTAVRASIPLPPTACSEQGSAGSSAGPFYLMRTLW